MAEKQMAMPCDSDFARWSGFPVLGRDWFFDRVAVLRLMFRFLGVGRKRRLPARDGESAGSRDCRRFD